MQKTLTPAHIQSYVHHLREPEHSGVCVCYLARSTGSTAYDAASTYCNFAKKLSYFCTELLLKSKSKVI